MASRSFASDLGEPTALHRIRLPVVCPRERSPSGLWRRTGNAVRGNPSRVRIPPSPPSAHAMMTANACVGSVRYSAHANRRADGSHGRRLGPPGVARSLRCSRSASRLRLAALMTCWRSGLEPSPRRPPGVLELSVLPRRPRRALALSVAQPHQFPCGASTRRVGVEICRELPRHGTDWRIPVGSGRSFSCGGSIGRIRCPRRRICARGGNAHGPSRSLQGTIRARLAMPC